jgi:uncharacterized membrane protein
MLPIREQDYGFHFKVVAWLHVLETVVYIGGAILLVLFFSGLGMMADDPQALAILTLVGIYVIWVLTSQPAAAHFDDHEPLTAQPQHPAS